MINVLIDLPLIFYKWVHYLAGKRKNFLSKKSDIVDLIRGAHSTLFYAVNNYSSYLDKVFLVVDSKESSWRKYIDVEGDKFYKMLVKEYKFDHRIFIQTLNKYCDIVNKAGVYVIKYPHSEGDDMIHILSQRLYNKKESVIIVSSDSDLRQLVRSNESNFVYVYDTDYNRRKHFVDKNIEVTLDEVTTEIETTSDEYDGIFNISEEVAREDRYEVILSNIHNNSEIIDPYGVLFVKTLSGDKSDNVPSVYYYPQKSGKLVSFTDLRAGRVFEKYYKDGKMVDFVEMYNSEELRLELAERIIAEVKSTETSKLKEISDNIKRNIRFVFLHDDMYYKDHLQGMNEYLDEIFEDKEFLVKHREAVQNGFRFSLLDGSEYEFENDDGAISYDQKWY